ncbi:LPS export ABC transporter periplasmic protein LptC [Roseateles sp. DAIF2]|uniref:LPS export ABC transporter periplasmic protein LptC n=1 Tax=Roseateles sp. DAIF2 TaxID=2714952 RepID=UPI0018A2F158|nr:LPS export ABC transporter periplasmic protein LptC [Roseateles sp. DAIF2]QPF76315.1 LPS export ABC transporter periplasmic protein LptC [Roseateles sp. DAIF2]
MATTLAPLKPPAQRRLPQTWLWRLQSLLSAYLPLLLMAFLAAGTWWLVKNTPLLDGPTEPVPPRHVPDYRMQGFELQRFDKAGTLRFRIEGSEMRHYPDTDTVEIDQVRLRAFGNDGSLTLATAKRALGNGDGSELQLLGEVTVQRFETGKDGQLAEAPRLQVQGEFLHAFLNRELLRSHLPVRLLYAGGDINARGFEYDHPSGKLSFSGRSTARIEPRAPRP